MPKAEQGSNSERHTVITQWVPGFGREVGVKPTAICIRWKDGLDRAPPRTEPEQDICPAISLHLALAGLAAPPTNFLLSANRLG